MKRIGMGFVVALVFACQAGATITIEDLDGNDMSHHCAVSWNNGTSAWDIWINSRAPGNYFVIRSDAGENIGIIRSMVASDGLSHTQVIVQVLSDEGSGVANLGEIRKVNTEIMIVNQVDVTGTVGKIECDQIGNIVADGDILGPIISTGQHFTSGVTAVKSNDGNVLADISVAAYPNSTLDRIGSVTAPNGTIGTDANDRVTLSAVSYIGTIKARSIFADISVSPVEQQDLGDVRSVRAFGYTDSGQVWHPAECSGSITAVNILGIDPNDEGFNIDGDVTNMQITLTNSIRDDFIITGGDFAVSSEINVLHLADAAELKIKKDGNGVGGSILGDMYFTGVLGAQSLIEIDRSHAGTMVFNGDGTSSLNDDIYILGDLGNGEGLTGQIILNADATPLNEGWGDGLVKFGPDGTGQIILDPVPYYNNKSDDFGGGAVGLAPYYCHYKDCTPRGTKVDEASNGEDGLIPCEDGYHAQLRVSPNAITSTVTIRHYGPVMQDGIGKPFEVWAKPIGTDPCDEFDVWNWTEVTSSFTHSFPVGDPRAIEITGPFADAHDYLIRPKTSGAVMLVCDGLTTSNTVPVKDYDYRIRVFYLQNLNMTGGLEPGDIASWILDPQDTTLDGTTDNNDLIDVIDAVAEYGE